VELCVTPVVRNLGSIHHLRDITILRPLEIAVLNFAVWPVQKVPLRTAERLAVDREEAMKPRGRVASFY
jgi:hypothetical protein